jgi:hypothetical protein
MFASMVPFRLTISDLAPRQSMVLTRQLRVKRGRGSYKWVASATAEAWATINKLRIAMLW